jgi:PAS domain S-box-containing protein
VQRSRLESIVDHAPVGILFVDGATGLVIANQEAARIFGHPVRTKAERQRCLGQVHHTNGRPADADHLPAFRALRGETVGGTELLVVQASGETLTIRWSAAPVHGTHGEIVGGVSVLQDVTALKQLDRLRQEWTAMVAHDIRHPVATISLAAQLLREGLKSAPSVRRWVEDIISDSRRLDRMIADLLDESRIETGRLSVRRQRADVASLVAGIVARLGRAYPERAIRFSQSGRLPAMELDPGRADQVLTNLITNAAKYGYEGTEIGVELVGRDDAVELTVINQGPGIPAEDLPRVFDRFYRTAGARVAGKEGLGLGLYIVRGIVEAHGGRIWAESDPGRTTRFHIVLPISPPNTRPAE